MAPRKAPRKAAAEMEIDSATRWLYTPHTIAFLFIGLQAEGLSSATPSSLPEQALITPPAIDAGLLALIWVARPFNPEPRPADPAAAQAQAYDHARTGIWAMVLVYLGGTACRQGSAVMREG